MRQLIYIAIFFSSFLNLLGQNKDSLRPAMPDYYRREEIIVSSKRYRIHNNYLSFGPGFLYNNLQKQSQRAIGIDFQFHVKRQHFQVGLMMSGPNFNSNNDVEAKIGYGYRKETRAVNLAAFAGANYYTGVLTVVDSAGDILPEFYSGIGGYACVQAVKKFAYDFGLGAELFAEVSGRRRMFGFKIIAFFSGAYRGPKKGYNPNVRSEYTQ